MAPVSVILCTYVYCKVVCFLDFILDQIICWFLCLDINSILIWLGLV